MFALNFHAFYLPVMNKKLPAFVLASSKDKVLIWRRNHSKSSHFVRRMRLISIHFGSFSEFILSDKFRWSKNQLVPQSIQFQLANTHIRCISKRSAVSLHRNYLSNLKAFDNYFQTMIMNKLCLFFPNKFFDINMNPPTLRLKCSCWICFWLKVISTSRSATA